MEKYMNTECHELFYIISVAEYTLPDALENVSYLLNYGPFKVMPMAKQWMTLFPYNNAPLIASELRLN